MYPVVVDPLLAVEQPKFLPNSPGATDVYFGQSIATSGDTTLVGAPHYGSGSVYVFVKTGNTWAMQAELLASDGAPGDNFGWAVALSGDTAVVGAIADDDQGPTSGSAYVFVRSGSVWTEEAQLLAGDGASGNKFGAAVAVSDDIALVGAMADSNVQAGSAYAFARVAGVWTEQAKLLPSDGMKTGWYGFALAISDETAFVGSFYDYEKGSAAGAVYLFVRAGNVWAEQGKIFASDSAVSAKFGGAIAISNDTAVIASGGDQTNGPGAGAAYVFVQTGNTWTEQAKLLPSDGAMSDGFGGAVAVSGDTVLVGAGGKDNGMPGDQDSGAAYLFTRAGTSWTEQAKLVASDVFTDGDFFGYSVGVSSDAAMIAAPYDNEAGIDTGSVYPFALVSSDGDPCTADLDCASGFCVDGVCCSSACSAGPCDACSIAAGAPSDGTCAPLTGPVCDDGDACTQTDTCDSGLCTGSNPISCAAVGPCKDACDPATGLCTAVDKPDNTSCDDGDACTVSDVCQSGVCVSGAPVVCTALDACHLAGMCDPVTGECDDPQAAGGSPCTDADACTLGDTCIAGVCTGSSVLACMAQDECHDPGVCDPATGACDNPAKADGTSCLLGVCQGGVCEPTEGELGSGGGEAEDGPVYIDGGCGCRVGTSPSSHWPWIAAALAALGAARLRGKKA